MSSSRVHNGKAFAAEQKIREFKSLLFKRKKSHQVTFTSSRFNPKKVDT